MIRLFRRRLAGRVRRFVVTLVVLVVLGTALRVNATAVPRVSAQANLPATTPTNTSSPTVTLTPTETPTSTSTPTATVPSVTTDTPTATPTVGTGLQPRAYLPLVGNRVRRVPKRTPTPTSTP